MTESDYPLIKSALISLKKPFGSTYKSLSLVRLTEKEHLNVVFSQVFSHFLESTGSDLISLLLEPSKEVVTILGQLSIALLSKSPLVILQSRKPTRMEIPQFILMSNIVSFSDEIDVQSACTFIIRLFEGDLKFCCDSSTEYQSWISAFAIGFQLLSKERGGLASLTPPMVTQIGANKLKKSFSDLMTRFANSEKNDVFHSTPPQSHDGSVNDNTQPRMSISLNRHSNLGLAYDAKSSTSQNGSFNQTTSFHGPNVFLKDGFYTEERPFENNVAVSAHPQMMLSTVPKKMEWDENTKNWIQI